MKKSIAQRAKASMFAKIASPSSVIELKSLMRKTEKIA
jgi:hypothetical protein